MEKLNFLTFPKKTLLKMKIKISQNYASWVFIHLKEFQGWSLPTIAHHWSSRIAFETGDVTIGEARGRVCLGRDRSWKCLCRYFLFPNFWLDPGEESWWWSSGGQFRQSRRLRHQRRAVRKSTYPFQVVMRLEWRLRCLCWEQPGRWWLEWMRGWWSTRRWLQCYTRKRTSRLSCS